LVESVVFTIEAAWFGTPQGRVITDGGDDKYIIFVFVFLPYDVRNRLCDRRISLCHISNEQTNQHYTTSTGD